VLVLLLLLLLRLLLSLCFFGGAMHFSTVAIISHQLSLVAAIGCFHSWYSNSYFSA